MGFSDRTGKSNKLIELLIEHYWNAPVIQTAHRIFHEPYGYETHISTTAQTALKRIYTATAKHIRFTPDYIVGQAGASTAQNPVVLLEYKVTTTPRYTLRDSQWDSGQIEADAWENYMNLVGAGIRVALLIYCPYHSRPLLCEFPDDNWLTQSRSAVQSTNTGSRTDYCNITLSRLRTFSEFMEQEFNVLAATSQPLIKIILDAAKTDPLLQISHASSSSYGGNKAGFNWLPY